MGASVTRAANVPQDGVSGVVSVADRLRSRDLHRPIDKSRHRVDARARFTPRRFD
jgi:hypothetical protein